MPYKSAAKQRTYQRKWWRRRRQDWIRANGPCARCGRWDTLHLHHRDPTTKVSHKVWSWSKVRRDAELAKCEVLCRFHHGRAHRKDAA